MLSLSDQQLAIVLAVAKTIEDPARRNQFIERINAMMKFKPKD